MKIEAFAGVFHFNGSERRFALVDGELRLMPIDVNEASGIVAAIEDRAGVQPAQHPNAIEEQRARHEVEPPKRKRAEKAPEAPKVEPKAVEAPKPDEGADIPFGKPEAEASPDNGGGVVEQVIANDAAVRLDLSAAKRLADVISALQEQGITESEALIAECERLRPEVPLLARIPDMRDRVERTLATLGQ